MFFPLLFSSILLMSTVESTLIKRLNAALDYGVSRNNNDLNFFLGVSIAQGQLRVIKKHDMEKLLERQEIKILHKKCENLLSQVMRQDDPLAKALSASLWTLDSPLVSLSPVCFPHAPTSITELAESGTLTRKMSDCCLRYLLSNCSVSRHCLAVQLSPQASGYTLTHQILFWTLFYRKCSNKRGQAVAKTIIFHKCGCVFSQHQTIAWIGLPYVLRDLYIEQVVVCGLHGFEQFLSKHNRDFLLSLQTSEGCFSTQNQTKCEQHLSGVATAALSLFLIYSRNEE